MTDFFALLRQPRQPWLDPEELKEAFHARSLRAHPDARGEGITAGQAEAEFAQLNEAYRVLHDPRRRLQHLLTLEGHPPGSSMGVIPPEVASLFQSVATATQEADKMAARLTAATNPLSRSLLQVGVVQARKGIETALATLRKLSDEAEEELRAMSAGEASAEAERIERLQNLYVRFAFLTRWIAQLEEKRALLA
ncbi:MAG: DnaJ domain-containing protein [Chthoniobacterales bacterium]